MEVFVCRVGADAIALEITVHLDGPAEEQGRRRARHRGDGVGSLLLYEEVVMMKVLIGRTTRRKL